MTAIFASPDTAAALQAVVLPFWLLRLALLLCGFVIQCKDLSYTHNTSRSAMQGCTAEVSPHNMCLLQICHAANQQLQHCKMHFRMTDAVLLHCKLWCLSQHL
ncbi:TPA: hypothetical protein ACH3X2_009083 [Trebouxia sp. C0005]